MKLAEIHFANGEYEDSVYHFRQALAAIEKVILSHCYINTVKIGLAMAKVMNNDKDVDLELLKNYARGIKTELYEGWSSRYLAQTLLNISIELMPEAETWINRAIEADRRNGMMFDLGRDYAFYAELFKRKGDHSKAKENLAMAIEILKECGADGWVEKYENEFAEL